MGYSKTVATNSVTIYSPITNETEMKTTGADPIGLGNIAVPLYTGELLTAVLTIHINCCKNTNPALNYFHEFGVEISNDGGVSYHTAISGLIPLLEVPGSSNIYGVFIFVDGTDIKQYITPGATINVRYTAGTHTNSDRIWTYSTFTRLELVFI